VLRALHENEGSSGEERLRHFISAIHDAGGAVIALSYRLDVGDADLFAQADIDASKIANFEHQNKIAGYSGALGAPSVVAGWAILRLARGPNISRFILASRHPTLEAVNCYILATETDG
jgi:hypothetical protein